MWVCYSIFQYSIHKQIASAMSILDRILYLTDLGIKKHLKNDKYVNSGNDFHVN